MDSMLTVFEVNVFSTVDDGTQGVTQGVTQDVTQDVTQGGTQDDTQGGTQDDTQDGNLDAWIETQIRNNPKITTDELAKLSGFTSRTIKRHIIKLTHIKYVGSGYSGHWEIEKQVKYGKNIIQRKRYQPEASFRIVAEVGLQVSFSRRGIDDARWKDFQRVVGRGAKTATEGAEFHSDR